jgi:hypothetical protein
VLSAGNRRVLVQGKAKKKKKLLNDIIGEKKRSYCGGTVIEDEMRSEGEGSVFFLRGEGPLGGVGRDDLRGEPFAFCEVESGLS